MEQVQERHAATAVVRPMDRATVARRRYNRIYMRRWRSDPRHFERELLTRLRAQFNRRVHRRYGERRLYLNRRGGPVCGFCRRRAPIKMQERLRISEAVRDGYVKVLIPCCGDC